MTNRNIVIFGETGAGKSSVVNLLAGEDVAKVASTTKGVTFACASYPVVISGSLYDIFDTAGLNEGDPKTMNRANALCQLYQLMISLKGGISLLVFCMRAPRIKDSYVQNWKLFHNIICGENVPIVIVVTGLENECPMDDWWVNSRDNFTHYGMKAVGHACITATKGKQIRGYHVFEDEYAESKRKVQQLIATCALRKAWVVPQIQWFVETGVMCWKHQVMGKEVLEVMKQCTMS
ncbi:hypothetical protein HYDPIDRAFT_107510 [Hydnomerulius pinastri MD-312]|nr:hypothetical protein HYDPIDRAFT_107510 [Hydnomerulius pinastri MD-312]